MTEATEPAKRSATGIIRVPKDMSEKLVIVAQAQGCSVSDLVEAMFREQVETAYADACRALTSRAKAELASAHAPDLGDPGA